VPAIRIGDLLVSNGLISAKQLDEALQAQLVFGGRLGTNLVELGYISTATLAQFLATQLGMPCLMPSELTDVPAAVLEKVSPEIAAKYLVFPVGVERRTIRLAMADPTDLRAVDEVAFRTGHNVAPVVAPELLVMYALERFYQVKRKNRFLRFAASLTGAGPTIGDEDGAGAGASVRDTPFEGPYGLREAVAELVRAEHDTDLLKGLMRYLREEFERVAVFVLERESARGYCQAGCTIPPEVPCDGVRNPLRSIEIALPRSVLFRAAARAHEPCVERMSDHVEDRVVARLLELEPGDELLLFPVRPGERVQAVALAAAPLRPEALREIHRHGLFASKVVDAIRMLQLRRRILAV